MRGSGCYRSSRPTLKNTEKMQPLIGSGDAQMSSKRILLERNFTRCVVVLLRALGAGSGRITDIYFAHPDGTPDVERTADYMETIQAVRRFARRSAPPGSYFLW